MGCGWTPLTRQFLLCLGKDHRNVGAASGPAVGDKVLRAAFHSGVRGGRIVFLQGLGDAGWSLRRRQARVGMSVNLQVTQGGPRPPSRAGTQLSGASPSGFWASILPASSHCFTDTLAPGLGTEGSEVGLSRVHPFSSCVQEVSGKVDRLIPIHGGEARAFFMNLGPGSCLPLTAVPCPQGQPPTHQ